MRAFPRVIIENVDEKRDAQSARIVRSWALLHFEIDSAVNFPREKVVITNDEKKNCQNSEIKCAGLHFSSRMMDRKSFVSEIYPSWIDRKFVRSPCSSSITSLPDQNVITARTDAIQMKINATVLRKTRPYVRSNLIERNIYDARVDSRFCINYRTEIYDYSLEIGIKKGGGGGALREEEGRNSFPWARGREVKPLQSPSKSNLRTLGKSGGRRAMRSRDWSGNRPPWWQN